MAETSSTREGRDLLTSCVHCGLCLEVCPTYQLTGDENNSPRGRLRLWREEAEGKLPPDPWTANYTEDCVGCLACESACPANVPYGELLEQTRHQHVAASRTRPALWLRVMAAIAARTRLFSLLSAPVRLLRQAGHLVHPMVFPGTPSVLQSTASYARELMERHRPTGPRVGFLTGCLMESVFREINFATVRVLIENNCQVVIPSAQGCCGAMQEHLGLDHVPALRGANRSAFAAAGVDTVVCNSSGCGLALQKSLHGATACQPEPCCGSNTGCGTQSTPAPRDRDTIRVCDVLEFLNELPIKTRQRDACSARVYVDLPCHLVHGQKSAGVSRKVMEASGYDWELAPNARDCCGSGGVYNLQKPEMSRKMLEAKAAFLNSAQGNPVILATSNHVCMMQWYSARTSGIVEQPYEVRHIIQLLDPGADF